MESCLSSMGHVSMHVRSDEVTVLKTLFYRVNNLTMPEKSRSSSSIGSGSSPEAGFNPALATST